MSDKPGKAPVQEQGLDPKDVVWHRQQTVTAVRGPMGRLKFKTADPREAEAMYRQFHGIAADDKTAVVQAEGK